MGEEIGVRVHVVEGRGEIGVTVCGGEVMEVRCGVWEVGVRVCVIEGMRGDWHVWGEGGDGRLVRVCVVGGVRGVCWGGGVSL